jgi:hypothetical protein
LAIRNDFEGPRQTAIAVRQVPDAAGPTGPTPYKPVHRRRGWWLCCRTDISRSNRPADPDHFCYARTSLHLGRCRCVTSLASVRLYCKCNSSSCTVRLALANTLGVELAARTGFRLLHNHLTVNLVSAVFERNSEVWPRMLRKVRRDIVTEAAGQDISLIMTAVFDGTLENVNAWRSMLEPVEAQGGAALFVQLICEREELLRHVQQEQRRALDKLVDTARMTELLARFDMFSAAPFERHSCLDVTHVAPSDSATAIIQHYGITTA